MANWITFNPIKWFRRVYANDDSWKITKGLMLFGLGVVFLQRIGKAFEPPGARLLN